MDTHKKIPGRVAVKSCTLACNVFLLVHLFVHKQPAAQFFQLFPQCVYAQNVQVTWYCRHSSSLRLFRCFLTVSFFVLQLSRFGGSQGW